VERPFPAYDGDEPFVFVCYAHDDAEIVYQELTWLRDHGVNIWYDEGITPGEEFPERLGKAILGASLVLFYISPRSVGSRHCRNEVFFSLDRETPVLAVHLEKTALPPGLALSTGTAQAIMRYEHKPAAYCRKLLTGIKELSELGDKIEIEPEFLAPPTPWQRMRRLAWPVAIVLGLGLLALGGVQLKRYLDHQAEVRWALEEVMPEVRAMLENRWRDFTEPYELAVQAEQIIPGDQELNTILDNISVEIDIGSDPPGASVYYKNYAKPEDEWTLAGITPIEQQRMPIGIFRWKFELDGHTTVLAAASTWDIALGGDSLLKAANVFRILDREEELPPDMVRVQGAETPQGVVGDFFIDRHEVTNAQYQEFVDAGGYENRDYWQHPFIDEEQVLSWDEAMARFVDETGRPGPSIWIGGHYPERLGDHPVSGVSWYEAAAYARFAGRELPTATHWGLARGEYSPLIDFPQLGGYATFAPFSNIGGIGTVPVGSLPGLTAYGAYDLAGNVREWCSNSATIGKAVRGGAWHDNPYDFAHVGHAPPMIRSPGHGFRTALYIERENIPEAVIADIATSQITDFSKFEPVSDEVFDVYLNQFAYDRGGMDIQEISVDDSNPEWTLERLSVATPYGNERMIINLFLPRHVTPPFQTVIYFPGSASVFTPSSEGFAEYYEFPLFLSFLVRSGRALVFPVYQGTFERRHDRFAMIHQGANNYTYSEFLVQLVKDFRRTVDYLETRDDIDSERLAFYGMSWGGLIGGVIAAVETRIQTAILLAGGAHDFGLPEANNISYIPRISMPLLMMNGRYDTLVGYDHSALPMYEMVATPAEHKVILDYPTDHIPPKAEYVKEILNWLDKYLGPVSQP
jgi:hypothetical protein